MLSLKILSSSWYVFSWFKGNFYILQTVPLKRRFKAGRFFLYKSVPLTMLFEITAHSHLVPADHFTLQQPDLGREWRVKPPLWYEHAVETVVKPRKEKKVQKCPIYPTTLGFLTSFSSVSKHLYLFWTPLSNFIIITMVFSYYYHYYVYYWHHWAYTWEGHFTETTKWNGASYVSRIKCYVLMCKSLKEIFTMVIPAF